MMIWILFISILIYYFVFTVVMLMFIKKNKEIYHSYSSIYWGAKLKYVVRYVTLEAQTKGNGIPLSLNFHLLVK
jgi:hypothetical protein